MTETVLRVRGITKSFGARAVLRGIDLDAHRGDVIAILGGSGSGKSTFLRCLNLLELPDAGTIEIAGAAAPLVCLSLSLSVPVHRGAAEGRQLRVVCIRPFAFS